MTIEPEAMARRMHISPTEIENSQIKPAEGCDANRPMIEVKTIMRNYPQRNEGKGRRSPGRICRLAIGPRRHGQTTTEFAIGLAVLLLLIFGIVDLGRAVFTYNTISHCAREGTRYAIVHGAQSAAPIGPADNDSNLQNYLTQRYTIGLNPNQLSIASSWNGSNNNPGSTVTVTVGYNFQPVLLLFAPFGRYVFRTNWLQSSSSEMIVN